MATRTPVHFAFNTFGLKRVMLDHERNEHRLFHEDIEHGRQSLDPDKCREPLGYFHRGGPVSDALEVLAGAGDIAVIGLGVGSAVGHLRPGQRMVFLEIDPDMVRIAHDHFTYLAQAPGPVEVRIGDGLALMQAATECFGTVVMDAFDLHHVPAHLISPAALETYFQRLVPGGVVILAATHYEDAVLPVLRAHAQALGLALATRIEHLTAEEEQTSDAQLARFVVLARDAATLAPLLARPGWTT
jgi:hypothetical protein